MFSSVYIPNQISILAEKIEKKKIHVIMVGKKKLKKIL